MSGKRCKERNGEKMCVDDPDIPDGTVLTDQRDDFVVERNLDYEPTGVEEPHQKHGNDLTIEPGKKGDELKPRRIKYKKKAFKEEQVLKGLDTLVEKDGDCKACKRVGERLANEPEPEPSPVPVKPLDTGTLGLKSAPFDLSQYKIEIDWWYPGKFIDKKIKGREGRRF